MSELPKYTLAEAQEAKDSLVSAIEFAFFTALADITERGGQTPQLGPVDGGGMAPHRGRHDLIVALVDRLVHEPDIVLYPVPTSQAVDTKDAEA